MRAGGARPQAAAPGDLAAAGDAKRAAARALAAGHGATGPAGRHPVDALVTLFADPVRTGIAAPLTFQWRHMGKAMKGETGQSVTVPASPSMEYSAYTCTVLDADRVVVSKDFLVRVSDVKGAGVDAVRTGVFSDAAYRASRVATGGLSPTRGGWCRRVWALGRVRHGAMRFICFLFGYGHTGPVSPVSPCIRLPLPPVVIAHVFAYVWVVEWIWGLGGVAVPCGRGLGRRHAHTPRVRATQGF